MQKPSLCPLHCVFHPAQLNTSVATQLCFSFSATAPPQGVGEFSFSRSQAGAQQEGKVTILGEHIEKTPPDPKSVLNAKASPQSDKPVLMYSDA